MLKTHPMTDPVSPECRATVERLQTTLDGEGTFAALDSDSHAVSCPPCRDRVQAARLLLGAVGAPEPVVASPGFAARVVAAMRVDRRERARRRVFAAAGGLAVAAMLIVAVWLIANSGAPNPIAPPPPGLVKQTPPPEVAPMPREKRPPAPDFGAAVDDVQKPFETVAAVTPKVLELFTAPLKVRAGRPDPMAMLLAPARKTLLDLPGLARAGLAPVGAAAEKALNQFLQTSKNPKPGS